MPRVLVTGMSGTGKSSALDALAARGFHVVDTDYDGWCVDDDWDEARMAALLRSTDDVVVAGCVSNQGRFRDRFDAVVLLSAPAEVLLARIETRTTNDYGKSPDERARILRHVAEVEPLLRAAATHELDATQPLERVVDAVAAIASSSS